MHHGIGKSNTTKKESREYFATLDKLKTKRQRLKFFAEGDVDAIYLTNVKTGKGAWYGTINSVRIYDGKTKKSFSNYDDAIIYAIKQKRIMRREYESLVKRDAKRKK